MYQKDLLKDYISKSELRVFSDKIKVRLSKELAKKYDNGSYTNYLNNIQKYLEEIETIGIKYPANAHPILYIYIVPDDNYGQLLRIPDSFYNGNGGGRQVTCYDLDGFHYAYGISQNILEYYSQKKNIISEIVNDIHELTHMVHSLFFSLHSTICEGLAEAVPLYVLEYEKKFTEHRDILAKMDESQILTAREMLDSERKGNFGEEAILTNRTCSFRLSYISAYLLVRGCIETIVKKSKISKAQAIQRFLEMLKQSDYTNEWLFWDIADTIGIPKDVLLDGKEIQMKALNSIKTHDYIKNGIAKTHDLAMLKQS